MKRTAAVCSFSSLSDTFLQRPHAWPPICAEIGVGDLSQIQSDTILSHSRHSSIENVLPTLGIQDKSGMPDLNSDASGQLDEFTTNLMWRKPKFKSSRNPANPPCKARGSSNRRGGRKQHKTRCASAVGGRAEKSTCKAAEGNTVSSKTT